MTVDSFIAAMRIKQALLFGSTITFTRTSAAGVFNEQTASYDPPTTTTVYSGAALVRPDSVTVTDAGGTSMEVPGYLVKLHADTAIEVGDVGTISDSTHDAGLVGLTLRVLEVQPDEWQICRRVLAVDQKVRPT